MRPNENSAEGTSTAHQIDILSNGVKIRTSADGWNTNGSKYIFLAFAQTLSSK